MSGIRRTSQACSAVASALHLMHHGMKLRVRGQSPCSATALSPLRASARWARCKLSPELSTQQLYMRSVVYCDKTCQKRDWRAHKQSCTQTRLRAKRQDIELQLRKISRLAEDGQHRQALQACDELAKVTEDCSFPLATLQTWCDSSSSSVCGIS